MHLYVTITIVRTEIKNQNEGRMLPKDAEYKIQ